MEKNPGPHSLRLQLRRALESLNDTLKDAYADGRIWYESDVHYVTLRHLTDQLVALDPRWIVGSQHELGGWRPDIVCYHAPAEYADLLDDSDSYVLGVIEIKFASGLGDDLEKLADLQRNEGRLLWMVYGDHFSPTIHQTYAERQAEREESIRAWMKTSPDTRGCTILKCAQMAPRDDRAARVLKALNETPFWHHRPTRSHRGT